jgi:hypothetical protein
MKKNYARKASNCEAFMFSNKTLYCTTIYDINTILLYKFTEAVKMFFKPLLWLASLAIEAGKWFNFRAKPEN